MGSKKKKETKFIVSSQEEAERVFQDSKKKKNNSKSKKKESKSNKTNAKNAKKTFIIALLLVIVVIGIISCLTIKANADKVLVRDQVTLESGTSTKDLEERFIKKRGNLKIKKIEYTNTDKDVIERHQLATVDVYLNSKGQKVDKDEATNKKGTEEEPEDVLKKGYIKDTRLIDVYTYDVKIIAKDDRVFKSKLILKDTKAPKLIAKETVEVTEGDEIKADMFFERYEDASNRAHGDIYFVKANGTKKNASKYDKYELNDEDKSVGEHELLVVIEDPSKNVSKPVKVKLLVKEKSQETTEEIEANGGSSSGNNSSGSRGRSGSYSGGNSGGSAGGSACGSQGYARMMPKSGMMISQSMLFAFWGCNGSDANWVSKTNQANQELAFGAGVAQLNACNARYGGSCYDYSIPETVYDVATGKSVGMYAPFVMESSAGIVGKGYMLPGSVVMTFRNY